MVPPVANYRTTPRNLTILRPNDARSMRPSLSPRGSFLACSLTVCLLASACAEAPETTPPPESSLTTQSSASAETSPASTTEPTEPLEHQSQTVPNESAPTNSANAPAPSTQTAPVIALKADPEIPGQSRITVSGLTESELNQLKQSERTFEEWTPIFAVHVAGQDGANDIPMSGEYHISEGVLSFEPRFPLVAGLTYRAELNRDALAGDARSVAQTAIVHTFEIPKPVAEKQTVVEAVYPTGDVLPENQLKFYIHFSAPMSRGEAYQRVALLKDDGEAVEFPFLELGEELWDHTGTRFTLFFDPGRIKRGLVPREEMGPALETGKSYTLVIKRGWLDATGTPLEADFRKSFTVVDPDDQQPVVSNWKFHTPHAGSRDPLVVEFDEPLDHAMLLRVLSIKTADGKSVIADDIDAAAEETRWSFVPVEPWQAGKYILRSDAALEDRAGNSLARPFEVDIFRKIDREITSTWVDVPFEISSSEPAESSAPTTPAEPATPADAAGPAEPPIPTSAETESP